MGYPTHNGVGVRTQRQGVSGRGFQVDALDKAIQVPEIVPKLVVAMSGPAAPLARRIPFFKEAEGLSPTFKSPSIQGKPIATWVKPFVS